MLETIKAVYYASMLGISVGYHTFCDELFRYKSYREMKKRRVF